MDKIFKYILIEKFKESLAIARTSGGTEKYDLWIFGGPRQPANADGVRLQDQKGGYFKTYKEYGFFGNCKGGELRYSNPTLNIHYSFEITSSEASELRALSISKDRELDLIADKEMDLKALKLFNI